MFGHPSSFIMQSIGGFIDVDDEVDAAEDFGEVVFDLGLCFDPLWIFTPFFEVDSKSQISHLYFTSCTDTVCWCRTSLESKMTSQSSHE